MSKDIININGASLNPKNIEEITDLQRDDNCSLLFYISHIDEIDSLILQLEEGILVGVDYKKIVELMKYNKQLKESLSNLQRKKIEEHEQKN